MRCAHPVITMGVLIPSAASTVSTTPGVSVKFPSIRMETDKLTTGVELPSITMLPLYTQTPVRITLLFGGSCTIPFWQKPETTNGFGGQLTGKEVEVLADEIIEADPDDVKDDEINKEEEDDVELLRTEEPIEVAAVVEEECGAFVKAVEEDDEVILALDVELDVEDVAAVEILEDEVRAAEDAKVVLAAVDVTLAITVEDEEVSIAFVAVTLAVEVEDVVLAAEVEELDAIVVELEEESVADEDADTAVVVRAAVVEDEEVNNAFVAVILALVVEEDAILAVEVEELAALVAAATIVEELVDVGGIPCNLIIMVVHCPQALLHVPLNI